MRAPGGVPRYVDMTGKYFQCSMLFKFETALQPASVAFPPEIKSGLVDRGQGGAGDFLPRSTGM